MTYPTSINQINTYGNTQQDMFNGYYSQGLNNEEKLETQRLIQ